MPAHARARPLRPSKGLFFHRPPLDATGLTNWGHGEPRITRDKFSTLCNPGENEHAPEHPHLPSLIFGRRFGLGLKILLISHLFSC